MFLQMSFSEFKKEFPKLCGDLLKQLSADIKEELEHDKNYVVRFDPHNNCVEFGYLSDSWSIA